ncbi:hypothetical protein F4604DRAFT_1575501 [Suillus subluteus]|nr:hypothetical protein F4604DRAFT_1575501 [Suillus subluteus]
MSLSLKGKTCVITGVRSLHGISCASVFLFSHEGATLLLLDFSPENLPELKSKIENSYPDMKVTTIQANAANETAIAAVCEQALQDESRLDVFFANAGFASNKALPDLTTEGFMESMRVNALLCFLAIKYSSDAMMKTNLSRGKDISGGSIILTASGTFLHLFRITIYVSNKTSVAGLRSGAGTIDCDASKAVVNSIAKTKVYQLQKTDIRINTICLCLIKIDMIKVMFDFARQRGRENKDRPIEPDGLLQRQWSFNQLLLSLCIPPP